MDNKTVALLIALSGAIGAITSFGLMYLIPISCPSVMEWYHQALIFLIPIFLIIFSLGVYIFFKPETIKIKRVIKTGRIEKILTPEEIKIIEYLKGKESPTQADIRKDLNVPRATLSVLLSRMEKRNIIKREKIGKKNYVKLIFGISRK
ncbi:MAG: MarR family transcriptional regulator [Candidatus Micrarchaeota archaeon]|nr:MarR family transcriptional regulator [Candidatus Micrarchaeota archaeon]